MEKLFYSKQLFIFVPQFTMKNIKKTYRLTLPQVTNVTSGLPLYFDRHFYYEK